MGVYDNVEGVARKSMVMFFLIDTSGSMEGRSIAAVNDAMQKLDEKKLSQTQNLGQLFGGFQQ